MAKKSKSATAKPKAVAAKVTQPEPEPVEITDERHTAEGVDEPSTVGPTGLCLQCGKPADHKHAGV